MLTDIATDPMYQFQVETYFNLFSVFGYNIAFNEAGAYMLACVALASALLGLAASKGSVVPGRLQSIGEIGYQFIASMVRDLNGEEGMRFFPFVFSLFVFVLTANLVGMIPYFHTITSHIAVTFAMAIMVISVVILFGVWRNGWRFLKIFAPSGVPVYILWFVVLIEIFSFLSRPLSLGMRLFANMLAGHIALKIFAGFIPVLFAGGVLTKILTPLPLLLTVGITGLEFLVSFLQAYVFAILTCVYLNDAFHPGH